MATSEDAAEGGGADDLGFEAEAVFFKGVGLDAFVFENFPAGFHVGEIEIGRQVRQECEESAAERLSLTFRAMPCLGFLNCYKIVTSKLWTPAEALLNFASSVGGGVSGFTRSNNNTHIKKIMKFKSLLTGAAALGIVSAAQAQTQIDITGATAFRGAAHSAIKAAFDAGNGGVSYRFAVDGTTLTGSNAAIFEGNFPGITGTTTIRTSFTGSVEGILSLTKPTVPANQVVYLNTGAFGATTASSTPSVTTNATSKDTASQTSKFAFSDVLQASTPSKTPKLFGAQVGVIVFAPIINKGADAAITNITTQQFRQLALAGRLPTRFFTGLDRASSAADTFVYLTGRNDLSGTRTAFLAEIGYGISAPVKQYVVRASDSTTITSISLAPTEAVTLSQNLTASTGIQASSVFTGAKTKEGNGGYNSNSYIRDFMRKTSNATSVVNSSTLSTVSASASLNLVSWIGSSDVVTASAFVSGNATGGRVLAYNGEKLDLTWSTTSNGTTSWSTGLSPADRAKIRNGKYTAWGFQNLYYKGQTATPTGNDLVFFNEIRNRLTPTVVGSSGLAMSEMKIPLDPTASPLAPSSTDAAKRTTDGGIVAP